MKNFVFDLYGTLVDISTDEESARFIKKVNAYFSKLGVENFYTRYTNLCRGLGGGEEDSEIDISAVFSTLLGGNAELAKRAALSFRALSRGRLGLYRGVLPLLKKLKDGGAELYILSNAQSCFTVAEIEQLGIAEYFGGICLSSDFGAKKPSARFFNHIIERFGLDKSQTVYVGNDFKADICGAEGVGLAAAYVKSNISPRGDSVEEAAGIAAFATDSFKDLSRYLLSILT